MQSELSKLRKAVETFTIRQKKGPWFNSVKKRKLVDLEGGIKAYVDQDRIAWLKRAKQEAKNASIQDEEYATTYYEDVCAFKRVEQKWFGHHLEFVGFLAALLVLIQTKRASDDLINATKNEMARGPESSLLDFLNVDPVLGLIVLGEARRSLKQ